MYRRFKGTKEVKVALDDKPPSGPGATASPSGANVAATPNFAGNRNMPGMPNFAAQNFAGNPNMSAAPNFSPQNFAGNPNLGVPGNDGQFDRMAALDDRQYAAYRNLVGAER